MNVNSEASHSEAPGIMNGVTPVNKANPAPIFATLSIDASSNVASFTRPVDSLTKRLTLGINYAALTPNNYVDMQML